MTALIPDGVWLTMITPFTAQNTIDYGGLTQMIEWYLQNQVDGLLAVCQSSEMFYLSLNERIELARFFKDQVEQCVCAADFLRISADSAKSHCSLLLFLQTSVWLPGRVPAPGGIRRGHMRSARRS